MYEAADRGAAVFLEEVRDPDWCAALVIEQHAAGVRIAAGAEAFAPGVWRREGTVALAADFAT